MRRTRGAGAARAAGERLRRTSEGLPAALAALVPLLAAGCGQMELPMPLEPPELARVRERAPSFCIETPDGEELEAESFRGKTLVVVAADPAYARDVPPWVEFVKGRYGETSVAAPGDAAAGSGHILIAAVELPLGKDIWRLKLPLPDGVDFHVVRFNEKSARLRKLRIEHLRHAKRLRRRGSGRAERAEWAAERLEEVIANEEKGFLDAFGLVGEGPHVAAVGPDGTLLALIDGPLSPERGKTLTDALDEVLARPGK